MAKAPTKMNNDARCFLVSRPDRPLCFPSSWLDQAGSPPSRCPEGCRGRVDSGTGPTRSKGKRRFRTATPSETQSCSRQEVPDRLLSTPGLFCYHCVGMGQGGLPLGAVSCTAGRYVWTDAAWQHGARQKVAIVLGPSWTQEPPSFASVGRRVDE